jgi:ribosome-associated protein
MMESSRLVVNSWLSIPDAEIGVEYARSGGPGGQHVNKTETKVVLRFPVATSPSLPDEARRRLLERLAPRLTKAGELLVSSEAHRERTKNISLARARLAQLLREGLHRPKARKATAPSRGAKERRLADKRAVADRKRDRRGADD